mmetsp:Transcript_8996/g.13043  ORF Transcript_8996/g.13043 Transcript_8996/m.13043 type:complete len:125 (-) Transcript_8996:580-954(-)
MLGIPSMAKDVSKDILTSFFPTEDVLEAWYNGEDAEWPPIEDEVEEDEFEFDESAAPKLRFEIGDRVECRISKDGWASGRINQVWYRESNWPPNSWAPYKVELDDGRNIFVPGDVDQIVRREQK